MSAIAGVQDSSLLVEVDVPVTKHRQPAMWTAGIEPAATPSVRPQATRERRGQGLWSEMPCGILLLYPLSYARSPGRWDSNPQPKEYDNRTTSARESGRLGSNQRERNAISSRGEHGAFYGACLSGAVPECCEYREQVRGRGRLGNGNPRPSARVCSFHGEETSCEQPRFAPFFARHR